MKSPYAAREFTNILRTHPPQTASDQTNRTIRTSRTSRTDAWPMPTPQERSSGALGIGADIFHPLWPIHHQQIEIT